MKESSTYQAILEEGRIQGRIEGALAAARKILRIHGDRILGPPDAQTAAEIEGIDDLERLEALVLRLIPPRNWQSLLELCPGKESK